MIINPVWFQLPVCVRALDFVFEEGNWRVVHLYKFLFVCFIRVPKAKHGRAGDAHVKFE